MRHGTYSIVALDRATGELGAAVQSHWFSVGSMCVWARPGIGAVATQSVVEPAYGPNALDAAEAEGGDVRGRQSAALVVVPPEGEAWRRSVDLRVEDHAEPLAELRRLAGLQRAYDLAGAADELLAAGRLEEAGGLYRDASRLAPESDELLFWAGLALAQAGDLEAGVAAVRKAAEKQPNWLVLLDRLSEDFAPAGAQAAR